MFNFVLALFIDLSKAFDTIHIERMVDILQEVGFTGIYLDWFRSYLKERKYKVKVAGAFSESNTSEYGIPQGSNLGPLLFILYINKIFKIGKYIRIWGYADDLLLVASHKDLKTAHMMLQEDFNRIIKWTHDMDLIINGEKTVMMSINLRNKKNSYEPTIKFHTCTCPKFSN